MIKEGCRSTDGSSIRLLGTDVRVGNRIAVSNVSLEVGGDDFLAIIGPNGAGKSTLLRGMAGLTRLYGPGYIGFRPINGLSPRERATCFSYLPQERDIAWPMPVHDVVALGRRSALETFGELNAADAEHIADAIAICGLRGFEHRPITEISGGQRSRALLARALASDAPFLLADEPIASLDPARQIDVMEALAARAREGRPVVAVLHDVSLAARYCSRIALLFNGRKVADGTPGEILRSRVLDRAFRVGFFETETENGPAIAVARAPGAAT
jgi:iron complex transport system ATP-binding protein